MIQNQKKVKVYDALYRELKSDILEGRLDYSVPILGELDLADKYEISRKSVRKALQLLTDEGLLRKVPGHGTFAKAPEERDEEESAQNAMTVGVILPWNPEKGRGNNEYSELLLEGISAYCYRQGHKIRILESSISADELVMMYKQGRISGYVWDRPKTELHEPVIERLVDEQVPVLVINRTIGGAASLLHDYRLELAESVSFLQAMGHRNIAFLNFNRKEVIFVERANGYQQACQNAGLEQAGKNYVETSFEDFVPSIEKLLQESAATALILGGSGFMLPFLQWVERKQLNIPRDLSVLALDDSYLAKSNEIPITVYTEPRFETGKQAVYDLELLIKGQARPGEKFHIKGHLIARKSCVTPGTGSDRDA